MKVGIPKETLPGEHRVAAVPETVARMIANGFQVLVEKNAGQLALFDNESYLAAGATLMDSAADVLQEADIVFRVSRLQEDPHMSRSEAGSFRPHTILVGALQLMRYPETAVLLNTRKITVFSLEYMPRIARAQSMDVLSSMSNIAGYKSVLLAAGHLGKFFPMLTTAAGSIPPAKVVVIGAGVAGLQAIATARRLGAMVVAFDPRPVVEEQVKSLGANFVSMAVGHATAEDQDGYAKAMSEAFYRGEQEILRPFIREADIVITTALVPGRPAPILLTEDMIREMQRGAVVVDLAIEQGGNCVLTEPGRTVQKHGVTLVGLSNLPSLVATHASELYSRNLFNFLRYVYPEGKMNALDTADEIIAGTLMMHEGAFFQPVLEEQAKTGEYV